jgi:hypothetical protein
MKALCFALLLVLSLSVPACSTFTASGRMDHAYKKHMKKIRVAKERRRKRMARDIAKIPKPNATPEMPVMTTTVEGPQAFPSQD